MEREIARKRAELIVDKLTEANWFGLEADPLRRVALGVILATEILAAVENEPVNSVALTTTAKGKVQVDVKVYHGDPSQAAEKALALWKDLKQKLGGEFAGQEGATHV